MDLVHLGSRQASDLDESSHPSSVFAGSYLRAGLEHRNKPYETTWITSEFHLHTWDMTRIDDWRALVTPYAISDLDNSRLCDGCKAFDLDTVFNQKEPGDGGIQFVRDMAQMDADCAFCSLLTVAPRPLDDGFWVVDPSTGAIEEFSFDQAPGLGPASFRFMWQPLKPHALSLPYIRWPEVLTVVDFEALKENLTHCICKHGNVCGAGNVASVDKLLVLNCASRRLEAATTGTKYVALSYVWGGITSTGQILPRTIDDAMTITRKLGYEYLWVDQLCIDQNDPNKIALIRQMDRIYHNAEVTIIAAAGTNADYGIPGAGSIPRQAQRCAKIGRHLPIEKKRAWSSDLEGSVWNTRGWTYQEKLLSRRCLVFTDQEAWFTCALTSAYEGSETVPAQVRHLRQQLDLPPPKSLPSTITGIESDLTLLLSEYTARSLTEPSDVINAFSGILEVFEQATHPTYNVWGVLPLITVGETTVEASLSDAFAFGLCWTPKPDPELRLRRRSGFPSWSWAGWIGPISHYLTYVVPGWDAQRQGFDIGVAVSVELRDGTVLALSDLARQPHLKEHPELVSPFIHLDVWAVDVSLCLGEEMGPRWGNGMVWAQVELKDGTRVFLNADILTIARKKAKGESFEPLRGKSFTGVLLCPLEQSEWKFIMLVEEKSTWVERIGRIDTRRLVENLDGKLMNKLGRNRDGELVFDLNLLQMTRRKIRLG